MKKLAWSLLLIALGGTASAAPSGTLLVLNKSDDTVSFIDLAEQRGQGNAAHGRRAA